MNSTRLKRTLFPIVLLLLICNFILAQSEEYTRKKAEKLSVESPFTKIIKRELPASIVYEDEEIIAFIPLREQSPVHLLIVPKKRIPTVNDLEEEDALLIGKMFLVAKKLAKEKGIDQSGYRISINTNEDESVFHIHMHLLGGKKLGPMITQ